jgi:MFS family permease
VTGTASAGPGTGLPRPLRPFRHRTYRLLVASMAVSLLGSGVWLVAVVYQVIALGGGPSELSLVATTFSVGLLGSVLLGGLAADRLPKRGLMIGVEAVKTAGAAAVAALALTGTLQLWQLAVISLLLGAADAFFYPAYSALLPTILPAEELLAANGVEGTVRPILQRAIGPGLAGLLVGASAPGIAVLVAAGAYLVAVLALLGMPAVAVPAAEPGAERTSVLRDFREGVGYMVRTGWFFATVLFATVYVLLVIGPFEVLLPFAVRDHAGGGPAEFAAVVAGYGVGGAVGSITVSMFRLPRRYLTVMLLCWGAGALPLVVLGFSDQVWLMVVAAFAVGVTDAAAMVIWGTLLQRRVPTRMLGRVSSLDFFVSLAFMPVSMALAGPVGETVGIPVTFLVAGVVPVFLAAIALLAWRLPRDEIAHPLDTPLDTGAPSGVHP